MSLPSPNLAEIICYVNLVYARLNMFTHVHRYIFFITPVPCIMQQVHSTRQVLINGFIFYHSRQQERHRTKQLLAAQEILFPNLYNSMMAAMKPILAINKTGVRVSDFLNPKGEESDDMDI